jgi:hypothetical protein
MMRAWHGSCISVDMASNPAHPVPTAATREARDASSTGRGPRRRTVLHGLAIGLVSRLARAQDELPTIAVLPPDFLDDHLNPATVDAQNRRLLRMHAQVQDELGARRLYRVVDLAPARPLVDEFVATQAYLYRCPDCAMRIGRQLGTRLVMTSWVQKVSELILNFNVEVYRVASERSVLGKSVDMRGNQDASWERAVRYLVADMADKRAADPAYGI